MLIALDFYLGPTQEVAVVGDLQEEDTRQALRLIRAGFHPHRVVAARPAAGVAPATEAMIGLLAGKGPAGKVTTYICRNFACQRIGW